jgi:hypothetical protein
MNYAYSAIVGPEGFFRIDLGKVSPDIGFTITASNLLYPAHYHSSEELYFIIAGKKGKWQTTPVDGDTDREPWFPVQPGLPEAVFHTSNVRHSMRIGSTPQLMAWARSTDPLEGTHFPHRHTCGPNRAASL